MSEAAAFLAEARRAYARANARALAWMLARPRLNGVFLNTKFDALRSRDYRGDDGWRGPDFIYGWIQGRGLEALVTHAAFFASETPALAERLEAAARPLYRALSDLVARDGHAYFTYGPGLQPVYPDHNGKPAPQAAAGDLYTYSDAFAAKGLVAAAKRFAPAELPRHLDYLSRIVAAIEAGRFVTDERQRLEEAALSREAGDYGPRMILTGAAAMLTGLGLASQAAFAERFIHHVLMHHVEDGSGALPAGAVHDVPGGDRFNPGHAIEFAGFALACPGVAADRSLVGRLEQILITAFAMGFSAPGIRLHLSLSGREAPSEYRPWWSLPEAIRAAALAHAATGNPASLEVWQRAHAAFFTRYWREDPPLAYQTLTAEGPVDHVPATPDLDPGYHTGLSLLGAIEAIDRIAAGAVGTGAAD